MRYDVASTIQQSLRRGARRGASLPGRARGAAGSSLGGAGQMLLATSYDERERRVSVYEEAPGFRPAPVPRHMMPCYS
jgi:hypothetical protein